MYVMRETDRAEAETRSWPVYESKDLILYRVKQNQTTLRWKCYGETTRVRALLVYPDSRQGARRNNRWGDHQKLIFPTSWTSRGGAALMIWPKFPLPMLPCTAEGP